MALAATDVNTEIAALHARVAPSYDGSLDGFLDVYAEYHARCSTERQNVGSNDALDLDPLVYFRQADAGQIYVTGEKFWLDVVGAVAPGRVLDAHALVRGR